jgi:dihydrofolate reductase
MRRPVLQMSVSLDGYVAGPNGDPDWILPGFDDELSAQTVEALWQAGVHAMSAVTYGDMAADWPTSDEPYAAPMNEIPKVSSPRTLTETPLGEAEIVRGPLADEIDLLKDQPGKAILAHGGSRFAQSLAAEGLIDEYWRIHPVALGDGLPLFPRMPSPKQLAPIVHENSVAAGWCIRQGWVLWFGGRGAVRSGWRPARDPLTRPVGRVEARPCRASLGGGSGSAERGDARVGGEDGVGVGPGVEHADDVTAGAAHDGAGGVPEPPAQCR